MTGTDLVPVTGVRFGDRSASTKRKGTVQVPRRAIALAAAPALALMAGVFALPILGTVWLSFSDWGGIGPIRWVGLDNYQSVLSSPAFFQSLGRTVLFSLLATAGIVVLAALLAASVSGSRRNAAFYRTVWFFPALAPPAAVGVFWAMAVQPNSGVLNAFLGHLGLGSSHAWLASPDLAIYVVVGASVWIGSAFAFLLLLGAVEQIPVEVYEAARIDGASGFQRFWRITLPLIQPVLAMVTMLELIWNFNGFTAVWSMTRGGPGESTTILPVLLYKEAFQFSHYGTAAAIGVLGGLILLAVGFVSLRMSRSRTENS